MKVKTTKTVLLSIMAVMFLLGCKDVFHPEDTVIPDGKNYTVSFDRNGGSGTVPDSITKKSGESITLPNAGNLSRTDYTFEGWNTNASGSGTNYTAGSSFTVPTQNVTLYAKWEQGSSGGNPGSNEPGSSWSNAIELTIGNIASAIPQNLDAVWFKFTRYGAGTIEVSDRQYTTSFTSDIVVDLYDSRLSIVSLPSRGPIYEIDLGAFTVPPHYLAFSDWNGTYYVKVKPKGGLASNKGTFRIHFQDSEW
jgi:uncharacterized repeat protein (TIGR02543 family)